MSYTPDQQPGMNRPDRAVKPDYGLILTPVRGEIESKDGVKYTVDTYQFPELIGDLRGSIGQAGDAKALEVLAQLSDGVFQLALKCFPHWKDGGKYFRDTAFPNADRVSVISDPQTEEVVGFNLYKTGEFEFNGENVDYVYTHYAGIHPNLQNKGLMERSRARDVEAMSPDVIAGCSAVGEIHFGVKRMSEQLGRVIVPQDKDFTTDTEGNLQLTHTVLGELGRELYTAARGPHVWETVDTATLVRHDTTPYAQGKVQYPLFKALNMTPNDALIYMSMKPAFYNRIVKA